MQFVRRRGLVSEVPRDDPLDCRRLTPYCDERLESALHDFAVRTRPRQLLRIVEDALIEVDRRNCHTDSHRLYKRVYRRGQRLCQVSTRLASATAAGVSHGIEELG
ncbi:hypothetical protein [Curtobacterium sp. PhB136]|uniref:hypothetical protein n=1 Tax=Curtobacterium sp. PhB136 TaxID=2485181 RepID=UPI001FB8005A|nr:hypothetical protein [Curtobacterium sp. PhB136]